MDTSIDLLAVAIAAVLYAIVFIVWYSKYLFGTTWSHLIEMSSKKSRGVQLPQIFGNFILGLIISYFLAFFDAHLNVTSVADGMFVAFCVWLGFIVPTQLFSVIWCRRNAKLFFIETGANLLALLAMGGVIGA